MLVTDLDKELSLKIGDFKSDEGDGEIYEFEDRVKYLERGYSKLRRFIRLLMRDYQPAFNQRRSVVEFQHTVNPPAPPPIGTEE